MFVLGNLVYALAEIFNFAVTFYMWVVIISAVLSWVSPDPYNPIVRFIYKVTEPVLYQVRARLPVSFGGIDFAPVVVILMIYFLQIFVVNSLLRFSQSML